MPAEDPYYGTTEGSSEGIGIVEAIGGFIQIEHRVLVCDEQGNQVWVVTFDSV